MADQVKPTRRTFLMGSTATSLAALVGPVPLAMASSDKSCEAILEKQESLSKTGFPPYLTQGQTQSRVWEYATLEAVEKGQPIWSFSNLCYIYGAAPDLIPGLAMQEGNQHPASKIQLKKSWEITYNLCGAESEMTPRTAYNDSQPMLPIHLIDGDPETVWSSCGLLVPDGRPEWIRIDLPIETPVASVTLVCAKEFSHRYPPYGSALPKVLEIRTSRDAWHWDSVYTNKNVPDEPQVEIKFKERPVKQIWIIGENFPKKTYDGGYIFSIAGVEVRDSLGNNLALVSRGASVTVSSVTYVELNDRFSQDALWESLNYDLGNKWLRIGGDNGSFMWHYVEHEKGKLELDSRGDESISSCNQHGISMTVNLDFKGNWIYLDTPRKTDWVQARFREMNDSYNDPLPEAAANPEMYQGYLRYVEYMTRKLKDRVAYLELGNEWNYWFGAGHYVETYFEPAYKIVKSVWPAAKIMLGSQGGFDQNNILDCLGRERKYGTLNGKLLLNAGDVVVVPPEVPDWLIPERAGAIAIRERPKVKDATASADTDNSGTCGILLRYQDVKNFLAAIYSASDRSLAFHEVVNGDWGKALGEKKVENLKANLHLAVKVQGTLATFVVSDGSHTVSTNYELQHVNWSGTTGLIQSAGDRPQLFANFQVGDGQGNTLTKDEFNGPNGTIPADWKYVCGGPNPIAKGIGARIDAISWHPNPEPDAAYFDAVRKFQQKCRGLGFKGDFFANEIYAGSMYPPGPTSYPTMTSEIQMAKYLVKSLVGHSGLGIVAGPCHPGFNGRPHSQALCQATWGVQTLNPCRPTITYYMWRNLATMMDDFHPTEFPVKFPEDKKLLSFTFQRGNNERMVALWLDGPHQDNIAETKTDVIFPGIQGREAQILDPMNGTGQGLDFSVDGTSTVLKGVFIKDYPLLIKVSR